MTPTRIRGPGFALPVPVIGIGVLSTLTTLFIAVTAFAVVTGGCALAAAWHWRNRERPGQDQVTNGPRQPARSSR